MPASPSDEGTIGASLDESKWKILLERPKVLECLTSEKAEQVANQQEKGFPQVVYLGC
jgi:hypothetical protein